MGSFMYIENIYHFDKIEDMICVHLSTLSTIERQQTSWDQELCCLWHILCAQ